IEVGQAIAVCGLSRLARSKMPTDDKRRSSVLLQLHQPAWVTRSHRRYGQSLRIAPVFDGAGLVGAGDGAARRALLGRAVLAPDILHRVLEQRLARVATLLRTIVHQAVFANVQVAGAGPAAPGILFAVRDIVLETVDARVAGFLHGAHGQVDLALLVGQRP